MISVVVFDARWRRQEDAVLFVNVLCFFVVYINTTVRPDPGLHCCSENSSFSNSIHVFLQVTDKSFLVLKHALTDFCFVAVIIISL